MSIYGEGKYRCPAHGVIYPRLRPTEQLVARAWELCCPAEQGGCGLPLAPLPTAEEKPRTGWRS